MTSLADILAAVATALSDYGAVVDYVPDVERPGEELVNRRVIVCPSSVEDTPETRGVLSERVSVDVAVEKKTDLAGFPGLCDDVRKIARRMTGKVLADGWAVVRAETDPLYHMELWQTSGVFLGAVRLDLVVIENDDETEGS